MSGVVTIFARASCKCAALFDGKGRIGGTAPERFQLCANLLEAESRGENVASAAFRAAFRAIGMAGSGALSAPADRRKIAGYICFCCKNFVTPSHTHAVGSSLVSGENNFI